LSLFKKGRFWHYDFIYRGKRYQGSTDQTNINLARTTAAKVRSDAALEARGIAPPKDSPMFREFMAPDGEFLEFVRRHAKVRRTAKFYEEKTKRLLDYPPWKDARLSDIDEESIERYKAYRLKAVSVIAVNRELATLRKALNLAHEWKRIQRKPKVRQLPGENARTFVLSGELELAYLEAASYPLKEAAILMLDLGLRPEECVQLRKKDISGDTLTVRDGKSVNAARALPLTERAKVAIELLSALWPDSEFLFPGLKKGTHFHRVSLDRLHWKLRAEQGWPREFVLYSFRHTFGTRLAESGCHPFEIKALMGHSSISMTQRYVHPNIGSLTLAMKRMEELSKIMRGDHPASPSGSEVSPESSSRQGSQNS
jgi:integrase